jgi:predicted AAA+ superfamily ATPase
MMERLSTRRKEAVAQAAASLKEFKEDIKCHMKALLKGLRSCGKTTTACQVSEVPHPEKSKAGAEEMKADVVTFEERLSKMDATDLKTNPQAMEVVV